LLPKLYLFELFTKRHTSKTKIGSDLTEKQSTINRKFNYYLTYCNLGNTVPFKTITNEDLPHEIICFCVVYHSK